MLNSYGLFPLINKPTRVTSVSATLIDNIFTNVFTASAKAGILCIDITDHFPVFMVAEYKGLTKVKRTLHKYVRQCKENNIAALKDALRHQSWESVLCTNDVDTSYDHFMSIVKTLYDTHCPKVKIKINRSGESKPWFTKSLENACKKKNNLYRKFVKLRTIESEQKYKSYIK